MESTTRRFSENAREGIANDKLQTALSKLSHGFPVKRLAAMARLPEFEQLRDDARAIKEHTLANLGSYLERYESKVIESGGHVHWAGDAAEARDIILKICRDVDAKTVTKGKSMISPTVTFRSLGSQRSKLSKKMKTTTKKKRSP